MTSEEILGFLADLARETGLRVRRVGAGREGDPLTRSGVCRLRGELFVVLVGSDPLEDQIQALADGLRRACPEALESRYLPPAVRQRLDAPA
jgi:hypothetical protein